MSCPYEVLGIAPGASQSEIKKAYSRLLRTHAPESSPEEFIRIREAYDQLKKGRYNEDKPVFSPLCNERARGMQIEIETLARKKDWSSIIRLCEKCIDAFPGEMFFLYHLVCALRYTGSHGKALNAARRLAKENPGNRWAMRELGFCCIERGFLKQAVKAMLEAYALGARDYVFLEALLKLLNKDGKRKKMLEILKDMHLDNAFWQKENLAHAFFFYETYIDIAQKESIHVQDAVQSLCGFLEDHLLELESQRDNAEKIIGKAQDLLGECPSNRILLERLGKIARILREEDPEQKLLYLIGIK